MSKRNETEADRKNQQEVMKELLLWFQSLPAVGGNGKGFTTREIPTVDGESLPDYELWWNHLCVGVIEIKCRTSLYDEWMIDRPKMESLYRNYQAKGIPAMLVFAHMVDGFPCEIDLADLRTLIANKDKWGKPSDEMMSTTNHGKEQRKKPFDGFLLPRWMFWRITE
jgi:hypothetical protein